MASLIWSEIQRSVQFLAYKYSLSKLKKFDYSLLVITIIILIIITKIIILITIITKLLIKSMLSPRGKVRAPQRQDTDLSWQNHWLIPELMMLCVALVRRIRFLYKHYRHFSNPSFGQICPRLGSNLTRFAKYSRLLALSHNQTRLLASDSK